MAWMIFKPTHDITAFELASILQRVSSMGRRLASVLPHGTIESWPLPLRRHWRLET